MILINKFILIEISYKQSILNFNSVFRSINIY